MTSNKANSLGAGSSQEPAGHPPRWRRSALIGAALFVLGSLLASIFRPAVESSAARALNADRFDVSIPDERFTPEDVVRLQVDSMRDSLRESDRLLTCYSLASPSNRAVTGPYENFARLVHTSPYSELGDCDAFQIGTAVVEGDQAAVTVSTISSDDFAIAFRFVLARQSIEPYRNCWMTEAVLPVSAAGAVENAGGLRSVRASQGEVRSVD